MEPTKKTYWITKYLFTQGILATQCQIANASGPIRVMNGWRSYKLGTDAHKTEAEAIAHAKTMIAKKLASLDKQRAMLKKLAEELEARR